MQDVVKTSVKRQQNSKRRRRRTRSHTAYIALVAVLVLGIGAALSMTLFFNVKEILIENETDTPNDEIIELSGIKPGDNLVRLDTAIASESVRQNVVYAEHVTVEKLYPQTVKITVEKAVPVANISQSYGYLLVSATNRVLEELKGEPRAGLIIITGYNPAEGSIGMVLRSEDEKRDNVLKTMTAAVAECQNSMIRSIDMADQSEILVYFGDDIVFNMGNSTDAVYKLKFAAETIAKLKTGKKYKLKMIGNNQISVLPNDSGNLSKNAEIQTEPQQTAPETAANLTE